MLKKKPTGEMGFEGGGTARKTKIHYNTHMKKTSPYFFSKRYDKQQFIRQYLRAIQKCKVKPSKNIIQSFNKILNLRFFDKEKADRLLLILQKCH